MSRLPRTYEQSTSPGISELAKLGDAVARDGVSAHHRELVDVAALADALGGAPAAASVLRDEQAPDIARCRALAVLSSRVRRATLAEWTTMPTTSARPSTRSVSAGSTVAMPM